SLLSCLSIQGKEVSFNDRENYYTQLCFVETQTDDKNKEICKEFSSYLDKKQTDLQSELDVLTKSKETIDKNILSYMGQLANYNDEIEGLNQQIKLLENGNDTVDNDVSQYTAEIKERLKAIEQENTKIKQKLLKLQSYVGTNYKLTYLLNPKRTNDFFIYKEQLGLLQEKDTSKVNQFDKEIKKASKERNKYKDYYNRVETQRNQLEKNKTLLADLEQKSREMLVSYKKQEADILASKTKKVKDVNLILAKIRRNKTNLNAITASLNFSSPIDVGKFKLSSSVWHYPEDFGGGVHLGLDLAAEEGTSVKAPANGVILFSSNTCKERGYLGNLCGAPGAAGGGNQVFLISESQGHLFAFSFFHFQYDSVLESGMIVQAGKEIGKV
ncbi:MAG: hypothetical protein RSC93_13660, partial [Erysipelotrichaceae bacterium]